MKKLLLTAIVALAFCGASFAQLNPNGYETHYPFFEGQYAIVDYPVAHIALNGEIIDQDGNWADLEIASFVGDSIRGHNFLTDEWIEYGWPYPLVELPVRYDNTGELVSFKIFDHSTGTEYDATCNIEIRTGEEHTEIYMWDWDNQVIISYEAAAGQTFTKEIVGYTTNPLYDPENYNQANYYLIASPIGDVAPENVDSMLVNEYDLFWFKPDGDDSDNHYQWITYPFSTLERGKGYLYANSQNVTLTFTGTPLDPDDPEYEDGYDVTLEYYGDNDFKNWNLVGNPWGDSAQIYRLFYKMNPDGSDFISCEEIDDPILPMEGVFVEADGDEDFVTFMYSTGMSVDPWEKVARSIALNLSQGRGVIDRAIVNFGNARTMHKLQLNPNHTKVYIPQNGEDFAVVSASEMGEMPVNFKAETNGTYTLSFNAKNVGFNYLHLIDNMTGNDVDLLVNPSYTFDASMTDYASRFKLVFATGDNSNDDNFAFFSNGNFIINNEGEATLQVVDVMGRILKSETINGCANVNVNAATGVYMLRLINGNNVKTQKVVVE